VAARILCGDQSRGATGAVSVPLASAAYGAGLVRTDAGSYHWAFLGAGALCLGASLASTRIGRLRGVPGISLPAAEARR
jgi:hypothetical protein